MSPRPISAMPIYGATCHVALKQWPFCGCLSAPRRCPACKVGSDTLCVFYSPIIRVRRSIYPPSWPMKPSVSDILRHNRIANPQTNPQTHPQNERGSWRTGANTPPSSGRAGSFPTGHFGTGRALSCARAIPPITEEFSETDSRSWPSASPGRRRWRGYDTQSIGSIDPQNGRSTTSTAITAASRNGCTRSMASRPNISTITSTGEEPSRPWAPALSPRRGCEAPLGTDHTNKCRHESDDY